MTTHELGQSFCPKCLNVFGVDEPRATDARVSDPLGDALAAIDRASGIVGEISHMHKLAMIRGRIVGFTVGALVASTISYIAHMRGAF